jgi:hypothetical protein
MVSGYKSLEDIELDCFRYMPTKNAMKVILVIKIKNNGEIMKLEAIGNFRIWASYFNEI